MIDSKLPPNTIHTVGEPEQVGRFAVRADLTVLSADSERAPIGWTVDIREGGEVLRLDSEDQPIQEPLLRREDLTVGMRIYVTTLVGGRLATVRTENGELYWESEGLVGDLVFAKNDKCWVTTHAINKKLLGGP